MVTQRSAATSTCVEEKLSEQKSLRADEQIGHIIETLMNGHADEREHLACSLQEV